MLIPLIKKDLLLMKKYVLFMLALTVILPLFVVWRLPSHASLIGFILCSVYVEFMFFMLLCQKEALYPKAEAVLCISPYKRASLVQGKYLLFLLIFIYCFIIYELETMIFPVLYTPFSYLAVIFLINALFFSIYIPFQYKFGFERCKFGFMIILLGTSFLFPTVLKTISEQKLINFSIISSVPDILLVIGLLCTGIAALTASMFISIRIFKTKALL